MDQRVIDKYEIIKEIGRGNYGKVYLVEHRQLKRLKAIKEIRPKTEIEQRRVEREIKLLQQARHPHVITIDEVFASQQTTSICMEYAAGGSLEQKLYYRVKKKRALEITLDILKGVQTLHSRGIIHRDLKPGNILFDEQGKAKIGDFGIAKSMRKESIKLTEPGKVMGTVGYMSPEQLSVRGVVNQQSDIYSVGVMLYEMLTDEHPFRGNNNIETTERVVNGRLIRTLEEYKIDRSLRRICYKAIHKDKVKRYQQASDMLEDIQKCYLETEDEKEWISEAVLAAGKIIVPGIIGGILFTGIGMTIAKGANSTRNIWKKSSKEYQQLRYEEANADYRELKIRNREFRKNMYNSLQLASDMNITEKVLEGEKLYRLGVEYYEGRGVDKDEKIAYEYFKQASVYDVIEAYFRLGRMYQEGIGVAKNDVEARKYYTVLMEKNDARGYYYLGKMGLKYQISHKQGMDYLKESAEMNYEPAIEELVHIYKKLGYDKGVVEYMKKGGELKNNAYLIELGKSYLVGDYGLKQNEERGIRYLKKAIKNKSREAIECMFDIELKSKVRKKKILQDIFGLIQRGSIFNDKGDQLVFMAHMYAYGLGVSKSYTKAKKLYKKAIELGNSEAMSDYGMMYYEGRGIEQDFVKARELFEKSAELGYTEAIVNLGLMYEYGHDVTKDYEKAKELYKQGIEKGSTRAMIYYASMYNYGNGVEIDYDKAKRLYEDAARLGDKSGLNCLGVIYHSGSGVEKNYEKAKNLFEKARILGTKIAISNIGYMYHCGHGVEKDYGKARRLYQQAIELECGFGMTMLGLMYETGRGATKSYAEAKRLYEKGSKVNSAGAMNRLGELYYYGRGVRKDYKKAKEYYERAAKLQDMDGICNLAHMYYWGYGVEKNRMKTVALYEQAIQKGSSSAAYKLGVMYYKGDGIGINYMKAKEFYKRSAELGNNNAMTKLAHMYHYGYGVQKDYKEAKRYYEQAIAAGNTTAKYNLRKLENEIHR